MEISTIEYMNEHLCSQKISFLDNESNVIYFSIIQKSKPVS